MTSCDATSSYLGGCRSALSVLVITVVFGAISDLEARSPSDEGGESDTLVREAVSLSYEGGKRRVWLELAPEARRLHVRRRDTRIESTVLSGERSLEHHTLRVQTAPTSTSSRQRVLWAEVAPTHNTKGPGASTFHVAWHLSPISDGTWRWERVAQTQYSKLDGGQRLALRHSGTSQGARLIREDVTRGNTWCRGDEQPPWALESYHPPSGRFEVDYRREYYLDRAHSLRARWPDTPLEGPFTRSVYRWNHLEDDSNQSDVEARVLGDRRASTDWSISPHQLGRTYATARVTTVVPAVGVRIVPGGASSPETFEQRSPPESLLMTFSDGTSFHIDWPDELTYERLVEKRGVVVSFPQPIRTDCMSLVPLGDEERGTMAALSEITPVTPLDAPTREQTATRLVERMRSTNDRGTRRRLARLGSGLEEALEGALEGVLDSSNDEAPLQPFLPLVEQLSDTRANPWRVRLLQSLERQAPAYRKMHRTLARDGDSAAEPLLEWLETLSIDDPRYADVLETLGAIGAREALVPQIRALGRGSRMLRRTRIRAIVSVGRPLLGALFETLHESQHAEHCRDALVAIHAIGRQLQGTLPHSPPDAGALREVLQTAEKRRLLLHGLRAAKWFELQEAGGVIETGLLSSDDPLVRRAAISALRYASAEGVHSHLIAALRDPSPDVRLEAIDILGRRADRREETLDALIDYLRRATWPRGERRALDILADIDNECTEQYFNEVFAAASDHPERTLRAAEALIRVKRSSAPGALGEIVSGRDLDIELRERAITLLGFDTTRMGEQYLLDIVEGAHTRRRRRGATDEHRLRDRAMLALGRRQSEEARDLIWSMLRTGERAATRRHALRALTRYRDRKVFGKLRAWRSEAPSELRSLLEREIRGMREHVSSSSSDAPADVDSSRTSP